MPTLVDVKEANRWAEAVLKLIKLTQEGKMRWSFEQQMRGFVRYPFSVKYSANFQNNKYVLWTHNSLSDFSISPVSLEVFDEAENRMMSFPDVPPLGGLAVAVQAQASNVAEEILKAIAEAN